MTTRPPILKQALKQAARRRLQARLRVQTYEQLHGPLPTKPHPDTGEGIARLRRREGGDACDVQANPRGYSVREG